MINNKKTTLEEEINYIKMLIDENILDLAEEKLNNIKQFVNYKSKKIQIDFLNRYLNEKKELNKLKEANLYDVYEKFKSSGKLNYYFDDYYTAYQYFTAGYYLTGINEFNFYAARCLFFLGKINKSIKLFLKYNEKGYSKLNKSYKFLLKTNYFNDKQKKQIKKEYYYLKSFICSEKNVEDNMEIPSQEIFEEREQFDEINTILTQFENYSNLDKLKYIKYLYQKSYKNIADKLLKKYEQQIIKDKNAREKLLELRKNRKLYINQGIHANSN